MVQYLIDGGAIINRDLISTLQMKINILKEKSETGSVLPVNETVKVWENFLQYMVSNQMKQDHHTAATEEGNIQPAFEPMLYSSKDRKRFFLIPAGLTIPTGPLVINTLSRKTISVDESAVLEYEIPEAKAMSLARQMMRRWANI